MGHISLTVNSIARPLLRRPLMPKKNVQRNSRRRQTRGRRVQRNMCHYLDGHLEKVMRDWNRRGRDGVLKRVIVYWTMVAAMLPKPGYPKRKQYCVGWVSAQ